MEKYNLKKYTVIELPPSLSRVGILSKSKLCIYKKRENNYEITPFEFVSFSDFVTCKYDDTMFTAYITALF